MELHKEDLSHFRIPNLPPSIYYIPNFITPSQATHILSSLPPNRWISLSHRRLQAHPSILSPKNTLLDASLPPYLSDPILPKFSSLGIFAATPHGGPNHVLVNEYLPGQGILPHEDGAAYAPVVATVSLGASIVLDVYETRGRAGGSRTGISADGDRDMSSKKPKWRILQEPGSLLVTTGEAYTECLHGIAEVEVDEGVEEGGVANWDMLGDRSSFEEAKGRNVRGMRVSLTYRDVVRVSKVGSRILGRAR